LKIYFFLLFIATASFTAATAQQVEITNPLNVDRAQEVVTVPLKPILDRLHLSAAQAASIVAENAATGKRIATQPFASNPDAAADSLLLLVQLHAKAVEHIRFRADAPAPALAPLVFGREAQERKDDFAWENEFVAYRVYGPALQATGEITSGIDVWSKRVPNLVIDSFYKRDAEGQRTHNPALSYHKDNGQGLDSYAVGPTRGCGGTAVFADGKLIVSKNYTTKRILADGPIRFAFEVSYAPWDANGVTVSETKRITLDAGTHLNRIDSTYIFDGKQSLQLAAGIAVHDGANAAIPAKGGVASVWDTPQDATAGRIATGLVAVSGQHAETMQAAGHELMLFTRSSGEPFTYYAGSGWSKADMPTAEAWNTYLTLEHQMLEHPLHIRWVHK
jgi:hypothetical protein